MPDYRRNRVPGKTYFVTVNLLGRNLMLLATGKTFALPASSSSGYLPSPILTASALLSELSNRRIIIGNVSVVPRVTQTGRNLAAAFASHLVLDGQLSRCGKYMRQHCIFNSSVAELYGQAAKLCSKTVAPYYSWASIGERACP